MPLLLAYVLYAGATIFWPDLAMGYLDLFQNLARALGPNVGLVANVWLSTDPTNPFFKVRTAMLCKAALKRGSA